MPSLRAFTLAIAALSACASALARDGGRASAYGYGRAEKRDFDRDDDERQERPGRHARFERPERFERSGRSGRH